MDDVAKAKAEVSRLQAKLVKQRCEIARITKTVEKLLADKACLRSDLAMLRDAENREVWIHGGRTW